MVWMCSTEQCSDPNMYTVYAQYPNPKVNI